MICNLKALGLALVAMLAVSAGFSSTASAQFESEAESTTLSVASNSVQMFRLSPGGSPIECKTIALDHPTEAGKEPIVTGKATTTVTVEPTYANCPPTLGFDTIIDTNGCDYVFHLADNATTGTTDIECPTSTGIQITLRSGGASGSLACAWEVDTQTGLGTIHYKNTGTGTTRDIDLIPDLTGIASTRTNNNIFFCPAGSNGGEYEGASTITGTNHANVHVGIFVD